MSYGVQTWQTPTPLPPFPLAGISIDRGYQQITREFLPIRKEQLLGSLYGPGGRQPLLPEAQPAQVGDDGVELRHPSLSPRSACFGFGARKGHSARAAASSEKL